MEACGHKSLAQAYWSKDQPGQAFSLKAAGSAVSGAVSGVKTGTDQFLSFPAGESGGGSEPMTHKLKSYHPPPVPSIWLNHLELVSSPCPRQG